MKKTVVDFLIEKLPAEILFNAGESSKEIRELLNEARQLEMSIIGDSYDAGYSDGYALSLENTEQIYDDSTHYFVENYASI
jgi:hypothetical protein